MRHGSVIAAHKDVLFTVQHAAQNDPYNTKEAAAAILHDQVTHTTNGAVPHFEKLAAANIQQHSIKSTRHTYTHIPLLLDSIHCIHCALTQQQTVHALCIQVAPPAKRLNTPTTPFHSTHNGCCHQASSLLQLLQTQSSWMLSTALSHVAQAPARPSIKPSARHHQSQAGEPVGMQHESSRAHAQNMPPPPPPDLPNFFDHSFLVISRARGCAPFSL